MSKRLNVSLLIALLLVAIGCVNLNKLLAEDSSPPEVITRVFFQDDDAKKLRWADLLAGSPPKLGPVKEIEGFPTIDAEKQSLVQMGSAKGFVLIGIRDEEDGKYQSGWVLIDGGVGLEDHGDHQHSTYEKSPRVRAMQIDEKQGNPAHLYVYDDVFYLANDKLNGYTRIDPVAIQPADSAVAIQAKSQFIPGGGGHITLAAAGGVVGYSSWIDRSGENQGRVDVTPFATRKIAYSFALPHGGIHGATHCEGKVFFAPSNGICWVQSDLSLAQDAKSVKVNHLSLGMDESSSQPIRTGAFQVFGKHVMFLTGAGAAAKLHLLDASQEIPTHLQLSLKLEEGARPVGPMVGSYVGNWPMALVFHDHGAKADGEASGEAAKHHLSIIELDPNADGNFADAQITKVIEVGKSKVDGHAGHHDAAILADRRHALFTNPGDGTLTLLRTRRAEVVGQFSVGGAPSKIETIGGPSGH